jgi:hypothetical protein
VLFAVRRVHRPTSSKEFEDLGSLIGGFVRERRVVGQGDGVPKDHLVHWPKTWCGERPQAAGTRHRRLVRIAAPSLPWLRESPPCVLGARVRVLRGNPPSTRWRTRTGTRWHAFHPISLSREYERRKIETTTERNACHCVPLGFVVADENDVSLEPHLQRFYFPHICAPNAWRSLP